MLEWNNVKVEFDNKMIQLSWITNELNMIRGQDFDFTGLSCRLNLQNNKKYVYLEVKAFYVCNIFDLVPDICKPLLNFIRVILRMIQLHYSLYLDICCSWNCFVVLSDKDLPIWCMPSITNYYFNNIVSVKRLQLIMPA